MPTMSARFRYAVAVALVMSALPFAEASAQTAATVPVYDATQLALSRYTVLKRLGVGDWRSAFGLGGHADLAAAQNALVSQASGLGADGIINLVCFDQTDRLIWRKGYYCYGNAIQLKK